MGNVGEQIVTIATAIVGVAIIAVIVSRNSNTANVITAAGASFSQALSTAVSPVTGFTGAAAGPTSGLSYSNQNFGLPNLSNSLTQFA